MVEGGSDPLQLSKNEKLFGAKLTQYWDNREKYAIIRKTEKDTLIIRQAVEGNVITVLVEYLIPGLVPQDFIPFINNWAEFTKKFNPYCMAMIPLTDAGTAYQVYKYLVKCPWPLDDRYGFAACYPFIEFAQDEHLLMVFDAGLEPIFEANTSAQERKDMVQGRMNFGAWWFKPVKDPSGRVVSTTMFCTVNGDAGGKIPKFIQNVAAPDVAIQSSIDFVQAIRLSKTQFVNEEFKLTSDQSEMNQQFLQCAVEMRQYLEVNKKAVPSKVKSQLFGLFQQGSFGDCTMKKPSLFNMDGDKDRYEAWMSKKGVSMKDAQTAYIDFVRTIISK